MRWAPCLRVCLPVLVASSTLQAAPFDAGFSEEVMQTGLDLTTSMAWAPDGSSRLFITTKAGQVRIIEDGVVATPPFFTFTPVRTSSECGLESLAFHPSFATNGYLYAFVTVSGTEQRIYRLTANGNVGEDLQLIVAGLPTRAANHNGGALGIGPDGKLYWAVGDNGNYQGVDNDMTSLNAKVGRANLDGSVPSDNPFVDGDGPNNDYVWARGFRNPFTMTFQPSTERLWLSVVGTVYEQIFTPQAGDHGGYLKYENNQPAGFLPPAIAYRTNLIDQRTIVAAGAVRSGGVTTYTTPSINRFRVGTKVTVSNIPDASFNVTGFVNAIPSPTTFSLIQPGPDATSGPGNVVGESFGGCVTGGTFWDSSGTPATHQGDFFWGDYNSGFMMRAQMGAGMAVKAVDKWGDDILSPIDVEVGPDGNLYYLGHHGELYRESYTFSSQTLIVSKLHLRTFEGGGTAFDIRLALKPLVTRTVGVAHATGDADVHIAEGASLSFSADNWSVPQRVLVVADADADLTDDEATLEVASSGLTTQTVRIRITDVGSELGGGDGAGNAGQTGMGTGGVEAAAGAEAGNASGAPADGGENGLSWEPGGTSGAATEEPQGAASDAAAGGVAGAQGNGGASGSVSDDGSCGCRAVGASHRTAAAAGLLAAAALASALGGRVRRLNRTGRS